MAVDAYVANTIQSLDHSTFTWGPMANGDTGAPVAYMGRDRAVQVTGTFGTGGSVAWEGSNDNANWFPLKNLDNTAIAFTAAGLQTVRDEALWVRPHVTAGDGTTALTVILAIRKYKPSY